MIDTMYFMTPIDMEGNITWPVPYGRVWTGRYPDTRGTPTVKEDRIYVISGTGRLVCLNAVSRRKIRKG